MIDPQNTVLLKNNETTKNIKIVINKTSKI